MQDADFDVPLAGVKIELVGTAFTTTSSDLGNYVLPEVPPGTYTLLFSKEGYVRQVRADVVVSEGRLTEVDAALAGDFVDMEEFVVEESVQLAPGTEAELLQLRFESPALMDSISADLMSRSGTSDAASALRLVSGATVQDGKTAVIRGLPDRYVSSQLNGVRLPSADEDKRAVELDQFPSAVIESLQVSKTFTPDQQGDASGGAVNVLLKSIPETTTLSISGQYGFNSQVSGSDFLSYSGGGVNTWGRDGGGRSIQPITNPPSSWDGAAGTTRTGAPDDYKWAISGGGKFQLTEDWRMGGFASMFYERDSSFHDNGIDDSLWRKNPGDPLTPQTTPEIDNEGFGESFTTKLFDVTQATESVQWGGIGTIGVENDHNAISLTYLYTHTADDTATLAEDTRGKDWVLEREGYDPSTYDPYDPTGIGNQPGQLDAAPWLRLETLDYTERTTGSLQLKGRHEFGPEEVALTDTLRFQRPVLDWTIAQSFANLDQPDKRQFGSLWKPASFNPGVPPFVPPSTSVAHYEEYKPGENINFGNLQRIWKTINEDSDLYAVNLKLPFRQWTDSEGYLKAGVFSDEVHRDFWQESFNNGSETFPTHDGDWTESWSDSWESEDHPISPSTYDVSYDGRQDISAIYGMVDLPLDDSINLVGGLRLESTDIETINRPSTPLGAPNEDADAVFYDLTQDAPVALVDPNTGLVNPAANADFSADSTLPALGLEFRPAERWTLRASYARTLARQTFKELSPILQQEYLGGPIFIGNPRLGMSSLRNYDLRADFTPHPGGLVSLSWFYKEIHAPIEYVQQVRDFSFTTAVNYPKGRISGFEFEVRQNLGEYRDALAGTTVGFNATFLDSQVTLPEDEAAAFSEPGIEAPMSTRDMTGAPEHLYNLFATYDLEATRTRFGLFYTIQGDTLVAGADATDNFIPSVYATEYDTLNFTLSQALGPYLELKLQAKNLTNPKIEEVYRSEYIGDDVLKTSYTKGIDYSLSLGARLSF
ncbi:MAG: TonB-dependent receptor [Planctomycetes bacterium]|nr:TonB-dependent receptor [Planctomycetota bacterium]